jgi:hypothetical protein
MSPQFDWRDMFKPTDPAAIVSEIRRLNRDGLKPHDIAATLRIGVAAVEQALGSAMVGERAPPTGETR